MSRHLTDEEQVAARKAIEADALEFFTEYFVQNYPGPNTIISNPRWHAPKIFRAAVWALSQARSDAERNAPEASALPVIVPDSIMANAENPEGCGNG